ncbi:MAG: hypothetical protein IPM99_07260 [Rubrivivax sp.]|nr:hypothetical protein [Rubrivivax sp.]
MPARHWAGDLPLAESLYIHGLCCHCRCRLEPGAPLEGGVAAGTAWCCARGLLLLLGCPLLLLRW